MKILLQDLRNGMFCKGPQSWTFDKDEALDFLTSDDAIRFARQNNLKETRLVAHFREHNYQIQIPYQFNVTSESW